MTARIRSPQRMGMADLATLRQSLAERERQRAEALARELAIRAAEERARRQFADAVGPVTPLPAAGRSEHRVPQPAPLPRQREADERAALAATLSDEVTVESLLLTDDGLSFRRSNLGADVVSQLRRGRWAIQAELDLHGLRSDEARERLTEFLRDCDKRGARCLRIVHGKGHGSPGRTPVLKAKVQRWLAQSGDVLAFAQASAHEGGAGALIVLLGR
ncbi:MAG: Smr/MutS family protein [Rubrivivax sp.]|jgi:DNA-nicking Smr family endonuclease